MDYHVARILLLIDAFTTPAASLEGLTKLAKLDFLLRYPSFLEQMLRGSGIPWPTGQQPSAAEQLAVESRMMRYKYGPWDDRYYAIVGCLLGSGLADSVIGKKRVALRTSPIGRARAEELAKRAAWQVVAQRCRLLKKYFDVSGNSLKERIYRELPEVVDRPQRELI
jgi:hypothetical protein